MWGQCETHVLTSIILEVVMESQSEANANNRLIEIVDFRLVFQYTFPYFSCQLFGKFSVDSLHGYHGLKSSNYTLVYLPAIGIGIQQLQEYCKLKEQSKIEKKGAC